MALATLLYVLLAMLAPGCDGDRSHAELDAAMRDSNIELDGSAATDAGNGAANVFDAATDGTAGDARVMADAMVCPTPAVLGTRDAGGCECPMPAIRSLEGEPCDPAVHCSVWCLLDDNDRKVVVCEVNEGCARWDVRDILL